MLRLPPSLVLCALVGGCAATVPVAGPLSARSNQAVVLVSLDGFRWDYLDRGRSPNLAKLAARGVRAERLVPSFPTKTFPNHYTLVTGLYPEHHGVVGNSMRDPVLGAFRMSDTAATRDGRWWGGEPIWVTAEKQGQPAAAFFWPGSEAEIGGERPTWWMPFDDAFPNAARVDSVLTWLSQPEDPPSIVTLYYSDVDHAGHDEGPDAPATDSAIARVDAMIGRLVEGLEARGLSDRVNIVVVSDHGMHPTPNDQLIVLDDHIALTDVDVVDWTPVGLVAPKPGKEESVYQRLSAASPHLKVYRKGEVPSRFHFNDNARITPLVLVADEGWSITSRNRVAGWRPKSATHGWDNMLPSMGAIFVAAGPAFKEGLRVPAFGNVHVYDLLCRILGLTPAPNDGSPDTTRAMLRGGFPPPVRTLGASPERLREHVATLASDQYEGRAPGTKGDTLTVRYVRNAFREAGLRSAGTRESWYQDVPLVGVTPRGTAAVRGGAPFLPGRDVLIATVGSDTGRTIENAEQLFVGHGIVTGDGKWDDYKGADVRGKVVVMLEGTPPGDAWRAAGTQLAPGQKRRTAMERGALAVVSLVAEGSFERMRDVYLRELPLLDTAGTAPLTPLLVQVHPGAADRWLGEDDAPLRTAAAGAAFTPRVLPARVDIRYATARRRYLSPNVAGMIEGSDPMRRGETVVVTAHWDHLGRDTTLAGDQIFNGALDNAAGVAQLLELARLLAAGPRPARSVLFLATTAEEAGLLGAEWYVRHPLRPLEHTVAVINLDAASPWGRTRDVISTGDGLSSLDRVLAVAARLQGRRIAPDPWPEQGFYLRSDHYAFAKAGIPGLFASSGTDVIGKPAGWGKQQVDEYLRTTYHRPSDAFQEDWDFTGISEDVDLFADVIRRIAADPVRPSWTTSRPETLPFREALNRLRARR